ncbi:MAG: ABC transporter ATP-binding protein [Proteobacteria bacterium]|nr:ABC transporter ATP-binding protein [Pseudomonadota bacterium]
MNSSQLAICLKNISKSYRLYQKPSHRILETFHPFRKKYHKVFPALQDISLAIGRGETVGIVGRNGCGKSTLLQIICGIMPPTTGELAVHGRISAILELGAGFNPEFNGIDNVYLKCSILGIRREEVDKRIGDILAFADIGDFIYQPVKTYSSGMNVRLAFSVAINIDPDILVIDEALSVGDSAFQRKCFSRIHDLQEGGTTILFVSHSAGAVVELCNRAILIDQGEMLYAGNPKKVVTLYHKLLFAPEKKVNIVKEEIRKSFLGTDKIVDKPDDKIDTGKSEKNKIHPCYNPHLIPKSISWYEPDGAVIEDPCILSLDNERVNILVRNEEYFFSYKVKMLEDAFGVRFAMLIKTVRGVELGGYGKRVEDGGIEYLAEGTTACVKLRFRCVLLPGAYFLNAGVVGVVDQEERFLHRGIDVAMFEVMQEDNIGSTAIVDFGVNPSVTFEETPCK